MIEIVAVSGSGDSVCMMLPALITYRGRALLLTETARNGLVLVAVDDGSVEKVLTLRNLGVDNPDNTRV